MSRQTPCRDRRQVVNAIVLALFCLSMIATAAPAFADYEPYCRIDLTFSNRHRHVYGAVNTECTWGCPWPNGVHSHKWGNWGVNSNWSPLWDGEQYMGWQDQETYCGGSTNSLQWNSCTMDSVSGNPGDFNWPVGSYTQQWSPAERNYAHVSFYYPVDADAGCQDLDNYTVTLTNSFTHLFELDFEWWGGTNHELVTSLYFPNLTNTYSCLSPSSCAATYSAWVTSYPDSVSSSDIRVSAVGTFVWEDFSSPPPVP